MPLQPPKILEHLFPRILWRGPSDENSIYLTFDDGPDPDTTPRVLDILSKQPATASFFLLGSRISGNETTVARTQNEGHLLANHGFSHRKLGWASRDSIEREIRNTEQILSSNGWSYHKLLRPPFGHFRPGMTSIVGRLGYRLVMWTLMPGDYRSIDPDLVLRRTLWKLQSGAIVVLHDRSSNSGAMLQMLPKLLKEIADRGYTCKRLDEIKGLDRGREEG